MDAGFDLFMCGLCDHLVTPMEYKDAPAAKQCNKCGVLFCEWCINAQMMWQCPKKDCKTKEQPVAIHYKVKEILEQIKIFYPGSAAPLRYSEIWKHAKENAGPQCPHRKSDEDVQELISFNLQKMYGLDI